MSGRKRALESATKDFYVWQEAQKEEGQPKTLNEYCKLYVCAPKAPRKSEMRHAVARSTLYSIVKNHDESEDPSGEIRIPKAGRPPTLTSKQERKIVDACKTFESEHGVVTKAVVIGEAKELALEPQGEEEEQCEALQEQQAAMRYNRVGGKHWMQKFLARNPEFTISHVRRPVEKERASKTQPEVALMYFRLCAHTYALCQIQRAIGEGKVVPGWVLPLDEGVVTREGGLGRDPGDDVLKFVKKEEGEEYLEVVPLGVPLEPLPRKLIVAVDEKPSPPMHPGTV